jgi:maleylacetoacetate isomerase
LLASGTISGQTEESFGSMLELSWRGSRTVSLGDESGEVRNFLNDGDIVVMRGICHKEGHGRVGFGECVGKVIHAGSSVPQDYQALQDTLSSRHTNLILYSHWQSSSSWRVRIALAAKKIPHEIIPVDLERGEHKTDSFLAKNSLGKLPVLEYTEIGSGNVIYVNQSFTMIEFLDECFPETKSLIPRDSQDRLVASEIVQIINSGIQPLQNLQMIKNLEHASEGKIAAKDFAKEAISRGLVALEVLILRRRASKKHQGPYALGNFSPTIVDAYLIPQLYNARRYGVDVENDFPTLDAIDRQCANHPWFVDAHANVQRDVRKQTQHNATII